MSDWGSELNLAAVLATARVAGVVGLKAGAEVILAAAKQGAPRLTGALVESGSTDVDVGSMTAAIGFSDPKAVAAHENTHDHLRNGKRAKFLELGAMETADQALRLMSDAIARALT